MFSPETSAFFFLTQVRKSKKSKKKSKKVRKQDKHIENIRILTTIQKQGL